MRRGENGQEEAPVRDREKERRTHHDKDRACGTSHELLVAVRRRDLVHAICEVIVDSARAGVAEVVDAVVCLAEIGWVIRK